MATQRGAAPERAARHVDVVDDGPANDGKYSNIIRTLYNGYIWLYNRARHPRGRPTR